jgi:hypothetical protein
MMLIGGRVTIYEQSQNSQLTADIITLRLNGMGYKLDGQVHGLPKIYSHSSHVE